MNYFGKFPINYFSKIVFVIYENILKPIIVENIQAKEIIKAVKKAINIPLEFEKKRISFVKAEKVVKDPKKPIARKGVANSLFEM